MTLVIYGFNHKTASIQLREQACRAFADTTKTLQELTNLSAVAEVMTLCTCNRVEVYCITEDENTISDWLNQKHNLDPASFEDCLYSYTDEEAIVHLLRVACGLDSMIMGEPQILGQMKKAYSEAKSLNGVGKRLSRLMEFIFSSSKIIRTRTGLNQYPVSVAYAATLAAQNDLDNFENLSFLLIGAGSMVQLLAKQLKKLNCKKLFIASRSQERAAALLHEFDGEYVAIDKIVDYLPKVNGVISATTSPCFIVSARDCADVSKDDMPYFWADLAIPRDIDPVIGEQHKVALYNVDSLKEMVAENWQRREEAAQRAECLVRKKAIECIGELRTLGAGSTIKNYREKIYSIQKKELENALIQLEKGGDSVEIINRLAHNLTQKFLHTPTKNIRQAAFENNQAHLESAKALLEIEA